MDKLFLPCKKAIIDSSYQDDFLDVRTMERFFKLRANEVETLKSVVCQLSMEMDKSKNTEEVLHSRINGVMSRLDQEL